jgi:hypothetical protein
MAKKIQRQKNSMAKTQCFCIFYFFSGNGNNSGGGCGNNNNGGDAASREDVFQKDHQNVFPLFFSDFGLLALGAVVFPFDGS